MKIISWNIACLPDLFNLFGTPQYRLKCILNELEKLDADIICLQEVFSDNSRKIISEELSKKYNVQMSRETNRWEMLNGGLLIASKYPIVDSFFHIFKDACGEDWYSEKGFLHVIIQKTKKKRISIINTHLNAASVFFMEKKAEKIRMKQVFDILSYLHQSSSQYLGIICGDFNDCYNSKIIKMLIHSLKMKFKYINRNANIFTTFENQQLDYIITYGNRKIKQKYKVIASDILSDHKILKCLID